MGFQDLLNSVGSLGRFQILHLTLLLMFSVVATFHILLESFISAIPGHRCWVHIIDNDTGSMNYSGILSQHDLLKISIPLDSNLRPEKCHRFVKPQWHLLHLNDNFSKMTEPETEPCVNGWVYDRSIFLSTIVTEWNLVCESQVLDSVAKFAFLVGNLIGLFLGGLLSDRFGRKLIFTCALLQLAITGTCAALAPTFSIYCLLRFLGGISFATVNINSFLLMIEWTSPKFQALVTTLLTCAISFGNMILAGIAFAFRSWHHLQLVISVPIFLFLILTRWLSESARWLIMNNKPQKALKELRKAACKNGMKDTRDSLTIEVVRAAMSEELEAAQTKPSLYDLFRNSNLKKRVLLLCLLRFMTSVPAVGFSIHLHHLGSNVFLMRCLFGAVSIPASFAGMFLLNHAGRRISQLIFCFLFGIMIMATVSVPEEMQTLRTFLITLAASNNVIINSSGNLYSNELLPTVIRARALGVIGIASNIGAALSPLLMIFMMYSATLPWIIYGVFAILSGFVPLLLPETKNQPLPDSIQDVENEWTSSRQAKEEENIIRVTAF